MSGHFGLRASPGGLATPAYGDEPEVLRLDGTALVREVGAAVSSMLVSGSTLRELAEFAEVDIEAPFSVGDATPPIGVTDEPLEFDQAALAGLYEWFDLGSRVLDDVLSALGQAAAPATVQLWPEHFDIGTSVATGDRGGRVNLGFSAGDSFSDEPYVYIGPWGPERPGDAAFWNVPFGAVRTRSDIRAASGEAAVAAAAFIREGMARVDKGTRSRHARTAPDRRDAEPRSPDRGGGTAVRRRDRHGGGGTRGPAAGAAPLDRGARPRHDRAPGDPGRPARVRPDGSGRRAGPSQHRIPDADRPDDVAMCPGPAPAAADVADAVAACACELGVEEDMVRVAQEFAAGSLGLAALDFERNGYTQVMNVELVTAATHESRPLDAAWEFSLNDAVLAAQWEALGSLPRDTIGRKVWEMYEARGFSYPGTPGSAPPLLCQHDWVHVLADYGTTVESEVEVFGLIARANDDTHAFSLLAMVISLFETGYLSTGAGLFQSSVGHFSASDGMAARLSDALRRGALCHDNETGSDSIDFLAMDWLSLADQPVEALRARFSLVPKSEEAVSAGSVGPWEKGGISPFQVNAGREAAERLGKTYDAHGASVATA